MANKLVLSAALLLALVAFASATRFTAMVMIDEEEGNPHQQQQQEQQCRQQVQSQRFQSCQRYLRNPQSRRTKIPFDGEDEEGYINQVWQQGQQGQQGQQRELQQCCEELRNVDQQCRCAAIKHAVRQQQQQQQGHQGQQGPWGQQGQQGQQGKQGQQGQQHQQMLQQVLQKARNIPRQCQFRQPQQCQIRLQDIFSA